MVGLVSTRKFFGKLNRKQAVGLVMGKPGKTRSGLRPRIGPFVELDATKKVIEKAPEPRKALEALQRWREWISGEGRKARTPKRRNELRHQRELLRLLQEFGQRQPTAYQLAASICFQFGLKKNDVAPILGKLVTIEVHYPQFKTWSGTITNVARGVRDDLPYRIEKLLADEKQILDSKEIAEKLGIKWNRKNSLNINYAMQLLNQMQLVEKEPTHSATPGIATWAHRKHSALTIRHPNSMLEILEATYKNIFERGENKLETTAVAKPTWDFRGTPTARFAANSIILSMQKLKQDGLITAERKKRKGAGKGGGNYWEISLTEEGKKIMETFYKRGRKSFPTLRRYLLGIK